MILFILGGALVLGVCILVHELGHYLAGRLVGVKAEIFSIGYGRGVWKKQIGDTTWQVTAIPLGGYVKFYGAEDFERTENVPGGLFSVGPFKRMIPILGGPFANLLLGLVIFFCLHLSSGPLAPTVYLRDITGAVSPAVQAGLRNGDQVLSIDGQAVHNFHEIMQTVVLSEGKPMDFRVSRDGSEETFRVQPYVDPAGTSRIGLRMPGELRLQVSYPFYKVVKHNFFSLFGEITPPRDLRAYAYLRDGDRILTVAGEEIYSVGDLQRVLGRNHGETVEITVERESLPWLAPYPTHITTVSVPSRGEFAVRFRELVDQKYGQPVSDQMLASWRDEHQKNLSELLVNGQPPRNFENLASLYSNASGSDVTLSVSGRQYTGEVSVEKIGQLGFYPAASVRGDYLESHAGIGAMLAAAYRDTVKNVMLYPAFFGSMFSGRVSFIENAGGPVRIFGMAGLIIKSDYQNYLHLFAAISIALFIMNLIPFPIVDGGHIVFYLYEAVAGKPVSPAVLESIYKVAFSMLMFLALWIMYRDIIWIVGL